MLIDATKANCKGAIASLEKAMESLKAGSEIDVIVSNVPDKVDIYAWARRKGHEIDGEHREGATYRISIVKCK